MPTFLRLGLLWFKTHRLDEAKSDMRRAIELRPEAYGYHFALGFVLK